jgi:hypothetical protein
LAGGPGSRLPISDVLEAVVKPVAELVRLRKRQCVRSLTTSAATD